MRPLEGVVILEVTEGAQGPFASALLASLGAKIIRVERRHGGDFFRRSGPFKNGVGLGELIANRGGKLGIALDLKNDAERDLLLQLSQRADVFVENWRAGVGKRLGLDYESLRSLNPEIVYVSASGLASSGPDARRPCVDQVVQCESGLVSVTGSGPDDAQESRFPIVDYVSAVMLAGAVLTGVVTRQRTGMGQLILTNQWNAAIAMQGPGFVRFDATGDCPGPLGSRRADVVPSACFKTADSWIAVEAYDESQWRELIRIVAPTEGHVLLRYRTVADRLRHRDEVERLLSGAFRMRSTDSWLKQLEPAGVPCSHIIGSNEELMTHIQRDDKPGVVRLHHSVAGDVLQPVLPWVFSESPVTLTGLGPGFDEHAAVVLQGLVQTE